MADRTVVLSQNGRHAVRGLSVNNPSEFSAYQDDDDDLTYVVDLSAYLDGDTITVVTRVPQGVFISNSSNTTTRLTQRLRGFGYVDFKVQTSAGDVEEFRINILRRTGSKVVLGASGGGGTGVTPGDYGDISISAGNVWTIDPLAVTTVKIAHQAVIFGKFQHIAQNEVVGRVAAGTGDVKALSANEVIDVVNAASNTVNPNRVSFTQAGTGASTRTVDAKLKDVVSVFDFMTAAQVASVQAGDLAENVAGAIQAAVDAAWSVYMPPGTYRIDTKITLSNTGQSLVGAGAGGNSRTNSGTPGVVPTGVSNAATTIVGNFTTGEVIRISAQGCTLSNMCISGSTTLNNRFGQSFDATKPGVLVAGPNTGGYTPTRQTKLVNLRVMNQPGDGILMVNDVVSSLVNTCEVHCVKGSGFVVASGRYVSLTNPITPPGQVTFLDCVACWTGAHAFRAGGGTADADLADAPYRIVNINFEGFYNCIITANCVENSTLANAFVTGFNHTFMNCAFDGNTETSVPLQTHAAIYVAGINIEFINQRLVQVTSPAVYARGKFGGATRLSDNITFRSTFAINSSQGADYFDPLVDVSSVNSITVEVGRQDNTTVEQFKRLTNRPANTFWNEVLGGVSLSSTPINVACPGTQTGFVSAPSFTLADDQATYFEFDGVVRGTVSMSPNTSAGEGLIAAFRVGSSGYTKSMAVTDAANVNVSTSTGKYVPGTTDGVDGDLNIQADTATNRLYIQNRRGASYAYGCTFMNTSANSPAIGIITGPFQEGAGTSTASATSSATGTTF